MRERIQFLAASSSVCLNSSSSYRMLLNPRRYGDGAKDLWTTLNCVQENIIRGGQRDCSRRPDGSRMPKSTAIKGVDEDMKLNKAFWEMAEVLRNGGAQ